jgi:hypothetical protein
MKKCPHCGQPFGDEIDFCLHDGTPLVADSGRQGIGGYPVSGEIPTQYIPRSQSIPPETAFHSPRWVYPVMGVLCGLVVVLGFFAFFKGSSPDKDPAAQKNRDSAGPSADTESQRSRPGGPAPAPSSPTPFPLSSVNPAADTVVTVNSPRDGYLALKEEPCTMPCRTLLKIPHNTRLSLGTCKDSFEVADRRRGRWCYTSYGGYSGWVFDAFVTR